MINLNSILNLLLIKLLEHSYFVQLSYLCNNERALTLFMNIKIKFVPKKFLFNNSTKI